MLLKMNVCLRLLLYLVRNVKFWSIVDEFRIEMRLTIESREMLNSSSDILVANAILICD